MASLSGRIDRLSSVKVLDQVKVANPPRDVCLVFVGGSCAGKSTLAHYAVSHESLVGRFEIAPRVSTRKMRPGDAAERMSSVSWSEFHRLVANGELAISWERPLPDGSSIGYGCRPVARGKIAVYLGGHGIYTNPTSVRPDGIMARALLIGVLAPSATREQRLRRRSPELFANDPARAAALLAHDDARMTENVDILVHNYGALMKRSREDLALALASILGRS